MLSDQVEQRRGPGGLLLWSVNFSQLKQEDRAGKRPAQRRAFGGWSEQCPSVGCISLGVCSRDEILASDQTEGTFFCLFLMVVDHKS